MIEEEVVNRGGGVGERRSCLHNGSISNMGTSSWEWLAIAYSDVGAFVWRFTY